MRVTHVTQTRRGAVITQTRRGAVIVVTVAAGLLILVAAAYGCVPQRGSIVVEGPTGGPSSTIVGDGDSTTRHFNSWCEQPTDAAYAADGDTVTFTIDAVQEGDVSLNCPEADNELPNDTTYIYLENDDVYDWNDSAGYWDFTAGDGVGCYHDNANPILQGSFTYNGGKQTESFTLSATTENTHDDDFVAEPGEDASVLCVGENVSKGSDAVSIFAPLVVTNV